MFCSQSWPVHIIDLFSATVCSCYCHWYPLTLLYGLVFSHSPLSHSLLSILVSSQSQCLLSVLSVLVLSHSLHSFLSVLLSYQSCWPLSRVVLSVLVSSQSRCPLSLGIPPVSVSSQSRSPLSLGLFPVSSLPCPYLILILVSSQSQTWSYPILVSSQFRLTDTMKPMPGETLHWFCNTDFSKLFFTLFPTLFLWISFFDFSNIVKSLFQMEAIL